tara:strand:+ start:64 stop:285 length:222 start_codon:yes stop_codon:yes gene_type:complete
MSEIKDVMRSGWLNFVFIFAVYFGHTKNPKPLLKSLSKKHERLLDCAIKGLKLTWRSEITIYTGVSLYYLAMT